MRWPMTFLMFLVPFPLVAQTKEGREKDWEASEAVLREHQLPTKGPGLLTILRDRAPSAETIKQFAVHVQRLRAPFYQERSQATADLIKMGPGVRPLLENLLRTKVDPETAARLRKILEQFPAEKDEIVMLAAARLIVRDRPQGSLPVLLDVVPYATGEALRQEVQRAINSVAFEEQKSRRLLMDALQDADLSKKAAATEALLRTGMNAKEQVTALTGATATPLVRYQIGKALVEKHDKNGLPLLIRSLREIPEDRVPYVLDLLYRAAGENAPTVSYRGKATLPAFCDEWMKWYEKEKAILNLAKSLEKTELGYTIICSSALKANMKNKVFELGQDQAVRWEFDGPRNCVDMQILSPNRLLIAEYLERRVTERDFKGNILWQVPVMMPVACQRLANGHTFIATRQFLLTVDHEGKEVFTCFQQKTSITTAQRLHNGQMVVVTTGGRCHLLDPKGQELKSFQMGRIYTLGGNVEVLPNGRILAPLYSDNCIVEFDWQGTKHWQAQVMNPVSVTRLGNGNTLVVCTFQNRVVEIGTDGKEAWNYQTDRPYRARRR
jgi:hypothetical protein